MLFNVMTILYMVGMGSDQASCALVGQQLGANKPIKAKVYYRSFKWVMLVIVIAICTLVHLFRVPEAVIAHAKSSRAQRPHISIVPCVICCQYVET